MAQTPRTSETAYATPANMTARYDSYLIAQLCADAETEPDPPALGTNARLLAALLDASGLIETAAGVGGRYKPEDLQALTSGAGQAMLIRLCCDLAIGLLWYSRIDREGDPPKNYGSALRFLEALESGGKVFSLVQSQEAGNTGNYVETQQDLVNRNGPVAVARRLFGNKMGRR